MCRALRSAEYIHTCTAFLHYVILQPAPLALFPSSAQIASFGWTVARIPHAPAFAMGRAQRQLRQSQRPGQQNRVETPASDATVEVEVEVETDEEEPRRAPVSGSRNDMGGTATQLSPSELRILDYMVWHTHKPPKTVFLRPYIEEVRNASSSRPPLTADGQDEMLEARTMPIDPRGRSPTPQTTSSSSDQVRQTGSNTQIPDWRHDLLDFFAIPAAVLHAEGLEGLHASGSGGDASSNLWVVDRARCIVVRRKERPASKAGPEEASGSSRPRSRCGC